MKDQSTTLESTPGTGKNAFLDILTAIDVAPCACKKIEKELISLVPTSATMR